MRVSQHHALLLALSRQMERKERGTRDSTESSWSARHELATSESAALTVNEGEEGSERKWLVSESERRIAVFCRPASRDGCSGSFVLRTRTREQTCGRTDGRRTAQVPADADAASLSLAPASPFSLSFSFAFALDCTLYLYSHSFTPCIHCT